MLEVKNVTKKFGEKTVVNNLSFKVNDGQIYALLGTNGAGKTTTFRMILGLLDANSGEILLDGLKIKYEDTPNIGFLVEERSLLPKETLKNMIYHYAKLKLMDDQEIYEKMDYYLKYFNLTEYKNKKISQLSKGNQQKVQFITSVINNPKLLILDEPFSGLDPINLEKFMIIIRKLQSQGTMIIFSSHRIEHIETFCEGLTILVNGNVVLEGLIDQIKDDYKKKNIIIIGDVIKEELEQIEGVISVEKNNNEFIVKVSNQDYCKNVFNYVKTRENIEKYSIEKPSLQEIYVEKVGETYNG